MTIFPPPRCCVLILLQATLCLAWGIGAFAATDNWTNSQSGFWRVTNNWSRGTPPGSADTAFITNSTTKTVTVDASTALTNLSVSSLTLSAPLGITNTLLLADLLTNQPMQINSQLLLYRGGLLRITNSTMRLPSGVAQLNNYGGNISLENGLLDFDLANLMRLGRYSTNQASLTVKGGTVFGSQLQIGQDKALGTLTLSNGVINLSSFLSLGTSSTGNPIAGGTGVVTVVNGQLLVTNGVTEVGYQGIGQMNISGGTTKLAFLSVGNVQGAEGTFSISGGQLFVLPRTTNDPTRLGNAGSGRLNITGGSVALMNELILGDYPGGPLARGTGMVMIAGGSLVATNDLTSIGKFGV
ncbi:MAG: hypothetical protein ABIQ35_06845, partial [Verrucomicrobiota bacterium]